MARMQTNSALYFPLDVDYFDDRKIRRLRRECSDKGIVIHLELLCSVYSDKTGYYTELDDNLVFDISEREAISEDEFRSLLERIIETGLFDKTLYASYSIITSEAIQKRFQEIVKKKALKTPVTVDERYWLLGELETQGFIIVADMEKMNSSAKKGNSSAKKGNSSTKKSNSSTKKGNSSTKNATNKRKEKEIKENEMKEEERKDDLSAAAADLIKEYKLYIGKASENVRLGIRNFLAAGMEPQLVKRLIHYAVEQNKCSWQYIEVACAGNLSEGIMTLDAYNKSREKRAARSRKKGINNYIDTNKPDYSDFSQRIIEDMLREAEESEVNRDE